MSIKTGFYQHYKGGRYRVLGEGRHTETQERLVFYESLSSGSLWARPLAMFEQSIEVAGYQGPRFTLEEE